VTLSNPSDQAVTVDYATADGTATIADHDYTAASGTLTFAPGETSKTITVQVGGDTALEGDEAFTVALGHASNATIGAGAGVGTILNDDARPNRPPTAVDDTATTREDRRQTILVLLNDSDPDGDLLTIASITPAAHGGVFINGGARTLSYLPNLYFHGSDHFTYTVIDGHGGSATAGVSVTVRSVNDRPTASALSVTTEEDTPVSIVLAGTDPEGDALTFDAGQPHHGTLSGTAPDLLYTPLPNYFGTDTFTFAVNDGALTSARATVTITVTPVNDPPFFHYIPSVRTDEDCGNRSVTITGVRAGPPGPPQESGQTVTLTATSSNPALIPNPTITGSGTTRTLYFRCAPNAHGAAHIAVVADDGQAEHNLFTGGFSINVNSVNDRPQADSATVSTFENTPVAVVLTGSDRDGDPLTFRLRGTPPAHGTLTGTAPNLVYTPDPQYVGTDSFSFSVNDGHADSIDRGWVSIIVQPALHRGNP